MKVCSALSLPLAPEGRWAYNTELSASRAVRGSPREVAPTSTPRPRLPTIGQCQPSKCQGAHSVPDPLPNHYASRARSQAVQTPIGTHALIAVPQSLCSPCSLWRVFPLPILSIGSGPSCIYVAPNLSGNPDSLTPTYLKSLRR